QRQLAGDHPDLGGHHATGAGGEVRGVSQHLVIMAYRVTGRLSVTYRNRRPWSRRYAHAAASSVRAVQPATVTTVTASRGPPSAPHSSRSRPARDGRTREVRFSQSGNIAGGRNRPPPNANVNMTTWAT